MSENRAKPDQYQLRFPPGMRDRLKAASDRKGRSMNAEIIDRLDRSLRVWPNVALPDNLFELVRQARTEQREKIEKEINLAAIEAVKRHLPTASMLQSDLTTAFYRAIESLPREEWQRLSESFKELSFDLSKATAKERTD